MCIYLVGLTDEQADIIKGIPELPGFCRNVEKSAHPDDALASSADVVILSADGESVRDCVRKVAGALKPGAQLILIAPHGTLSLLGEDAQVLADVWFAPLDGAELAFRFSHWQEQRRTADDLWETRQFLDATIDSIPSLVWYKTHDGVHEKVNSSFCKTVGKTKEQVQGQRHAYIWDVEEDDPACIESENQVMASGKTCVSEEVVQTGEGTRLLTTYKSPLYDIDGSVMGTVGVGIDITQERAYENDLIEKTRTLETIFTSLDCGVLTHSLDGTQILGINQTALDILGFESEEDLVRGGFSLISSSVMDEDANRLKEEILQLQDVGDSISTEYRVRHDDGSVVHVMGNIKVIEKDGERFYHRFLLDVTDQRAHEEQKERRARDLIQALSGDYLVVCSYDLDTGEGEVLRIASSEDDELERMFLDAPSVGSALESYISTRVLEEDRELLADALAASNMVSQLEGTERFDVLYRAYRGNQKRYRQATVVRAGIWKDARQVVIGLRNVDQEIREQLEQKTLLEEALGNANRASQAKSAFLLNMSHDIRTPMNAIVGFTTLASNHMDQPERVSDYLAKIKNSSDHLLNLINDILDMSRIEQGKVTLDEQRCNLDEVFDDLRAMLQHEAASKGLDLEVETVGLEHPEVICDRLKLNQVLLNLLGNSIKFTPSGGKITAKVEEMSGAQPGFGSYRITVEDTGIGMSQDFLKCIFDPFERERTQTISGIQGSGLGMAIVKSLVDMMGGRIEVRSQVDVGTTFTVDLTFRLSDGTPSEGADVASAPQMSFDAASGYTILLVDDNMLNRELAEDLLTDVGFKVEKAVDGKDALDQLIAAGPGHFDLVLMDIQMPVMNGYEAAMAIRELDDPMLASIPILAVTADAFDEDRDKALECGMDGHLPKPIEVDKLFNFMSMLL